MVTKLNQQNLITANDCQRAHCSALSPWLRLWLEFSGSVNGIENMMRIAEQVYSLPWFQKQLNKLCLEQKVFAMPSNLPNLNQPYHECPDYQGCFICNEKTQVKRDYPWVRAFGRFQKAGDQWFARKPPQTDIHTVLPKSNKDDNEVNYDKMYETSKESKN